MDKIPLLRRIHAFATPLSNPLKIVEFACVSSSWRQSVDDFYGAEIVFTNCLQQTRPGGGLLCDDHDDKNSNGNNNKNEILNVPVKIIRLLADYCSDEASIAAADETMISKTNRSRKCYLFFWIWSHLARAGFDFIENSTVGIHSQPVLHLAILSRNPPLVRELLRVSGYGDSSRSEENNTTATPPTTKKTEPLQSYDSNGRSVLFKAIEHCVDPEIVELLLDQGRANPNETSTTSYSIYPLIESSVQARNQSGYALVARNSATASSSPSGALVGVAEPQTLKNNRKNAELLLKFGADTRVLDGFTQTRPLNGFIQAGESRIVRLILEIESKLLQQELRKEKEARSSTTAVASSATATTPTVTLRPPSFVLVDSHGNTPLILAAESCAVSADDNTPDCLWMIIEEAKKFFAPFKVSQRNLLQEQFGIIVPVSNHFDSLKEYLDFASESSTSALAAVISCGCFLGVKALVESGASVQKLKGGYHGTTATTSSGGFRSRSGSFGIMSSSSSSSENHESSMPYHSSSDEEEEKAVAADHDETMTEEESKKVQSDFLKCFLASQQQQHLSPALRSPPLRQQVSPPSPSSSHQQNQPFSLPSPGSLLLSPTKTPNQTTTNATSDRRNSISNNTINNQFLSVPFTGYSVAHRRDSTTSSRYLTVDTISSTCDSSHAPALLNKSGFFFEGERCYEFSHLFSFDLTGRHRSSNPVRYVKENKRIIEYLIKVGKANPNAILSGSYITPLFHAAERGNDDICEALLQNGAKVNKICSESRITPLIGAAKNGRLHVTKVLLKYNADPFISTPDGLLARMIAKSYWYHAIATEIEAAEKRISLKKKKEQQQQQLQQLQV